jgi:hypothetical protein
MAVGIAFYTRDAARDVVGVHLLQAQFLRRQWVGGLDDVGRLRSFSMRQL